MKTVFAAIAAVGALTAVAAPAAAQPYGVQSYGHDRYDPARGGYNLNQRQEQLNRRIEIGLRTGDLSRQEAGRLREDARDIARIEARYRVNGLTGWERADLDRRFDRLEARIRYERHDREYGYGYGQRR